MRKIPAILIVTLFRIPSSSSKKSEGNRGRGRLRWMASRVWPCDFAESHNADILTSPENDLAHFHIVARAPACAQRAGKSCPCLLDIFHGRDLPAALRRRHGAHATKNGANSFSGKHPQSPAEVRKSVMRIASPLTYPAQTFIFRKMRGNCFGLDLKFGMRAKPVLRWKRHNATTQHRFSVQRPAAPGYMRMLSTTWSPIPMNGWVQEART